MEWTERGDYFMTEFDLFARIRQLCLERNWSYYQLSKASGLTYSTISTLLNRQTLLSLTTLNKICHGFGISLADFFSTDADSSMSAEEIQCLALFSSLSPEDQQLALAYMKGLTKSL